MIKFITFISHHLQNRQHFIIKTQSDRLRSKYNTIHIMTRPYVLTIISTGSNCPFKFGPKFNHSGSWEHACSYISVLLIRRCLAALAEAHDGLLILKSVKFVQIKLKDIMRV